MQKQGTEGRDHPPLSTRFWIPSEILGDSEITLGRTDFCTIFCLSISKIWAIFTNIFSQGLKNHFPSFFRLSSVFISTFSPNFPLCLEMNYTPVSMRSSFNQLNTRMLQNQQINWTAVPKHCTSWYCTATFEIMDIQCQKLHQWFYGG